MRVKNMWHTCEGVFMHAFDGVCACHDQTWACMGACVRARVLRRGVHPAKKKVACATIRVYFI